MHSEFNFFQHWYPLTPIEDLDPQQPTAVTVLGQRLVIWRPNTASEYRVFLDQCPHRLAPLSEGRVDAATGNLMCSYHGWQFDAQGACVAIPQADRSQFLDQEQSPLCATALPSQQANDLLWVWLDRHSPELAATTPLPLSPQLDRSQGFVWSSFVRDLEYDWQTLVENVADPSHVPFAHHGVQGNRKQARPVPLAIEHSSIDRIEACVDRAKATTALPFSTTITFEPPCRLEYKIRLGESGKQVGLVTYCIPTVPGKSRIVAQFPRNFAQTMHRFTPRWFEHIKVRNQVLDGDMILLHQQEHYLRQRLRQHPTIDSWKTAYHLPTSADRLVIEFRRWFDKYCQGQLPWQAVGIDPAEQAIPSTDRPQLLDRYRQHTQLCSSCRGALQAIRRLQIGLLGGCALIVASVSAMPDSWRSSVGIPLTGMALLGLAAFAWLKFRLEPKFYFVDYIHAKR